MSSHDKYFVFNAFKIFIPTSFGKKGDGREKLVITQNCETSTVARVIFCCLVYPVFSSSELLLLVELASTSLSFLEGSSAGIVTVNIFWLFALKLMSFTYGVLKGDGRAPTIK